MFTDKFDPWPLVHSKQTIFIKRVIKSPKIEEISQAKKVVI